MKTKNIFFLILFLISVLQLLPLKSYSQQISRTARPSLVQRKGYRVSTTLTTGTSEELKGDQLVADHDANAVLLSPPVEQGSGNEVNFVVTPTSSLAQISNISHDAFFEFGEGTMLNTLVETKENAEIKSELSEASSSAYIIVDTRLSVYSAESVFAESY